MLSTLDNEWIFVSLTYHLIYMFKYIEYSSNHEIELEEPYKSWAPPPPLPIQTS